MQRYPDRPVTPPSASNPPEHRLQLPGGQLAAYLETLDQQAQLDPTADLQAERDADNEELA